MAPARPMLAEIELQQVQSIDVEADQVLVQHAVPALEGDFLQRLDRRASRISLRGILTGDEVREGLEKLRAQFRAAAPVSFVADLTTATKVEQVLIEELGVRELAGKPARFEYAFTLREFLSPPAPAVEPPPPEPPQEPDPETGTLVVEVIVEGQPSFDFTTVTVTVAGTQADDTTLSRTLPTQEQNVWTEEQFPPGQYTTSAVVTEPQSMSGSASATVRPGQTTRVTITLRAGSIIAKAFVVHFRFDKSFVEPCMRHVLHQVSQYAQDHADEKLLIVGHTDKTGSEQYNQSLSERRARSVFAYMTFGRDRPTSLREWNDLRRSRPVGTTISLNDTWGAREYQYMLQDLGFYQGDVNGDATSSDAAVREFQEAQGLTVDGIVGDQTWAALIEAYLSQEPLAVPESQFLPNAGDGCNSGILKWLGCGEENPLPQPQPSTQNPHRPYRRVELLFVRATRLPCAVPQPATFNLPTPGAVAADWCLGAGNPQRHCCFATRDCAQAEPGQWCIVPAEPTTIAVRGSIKFEDGTPAANVHYVLIAPDGEFMDGEATSGSRRGNGILGRTGADGTFVYANPKGVGTYTLEIEDPLIVRLDGEALEAAKGNVVCKRLDGSSDFDVVVFDEDISEDQPIVRPTITLASAVVVMKKPYTNPARQVVTLRADSSFNGSGTVTATGSAIRFFRTATGGSPITFNGVDNVFTGDQLNAGVQLFAEGVSASAALNDVQLRLALSRASGSTTPRIGRPATARMTSVEVILDICMSRSAPGVDPPALPQPPATPHVGGNPTDKVFGGRFVQVQDAGNHAGRAMLIVRKSRPAAFNGTLVLTTNDARIQIFRNETPGDAPLTVPHEIANNTIPAAGARLFVEGRSVSSALRDTGLRLGIKDLENDGDQVKVTVAQFTRIRATIRSTPPTSVRAGFPAPADHIFNNTSISDDFTVNVPLVLMRNAQPDIQLEVSAAPAGLPIRWQAIRNPSDHASLGNASALPTVTPDATNVLRAQLSANQRGAFRIRAYIDSNGSNTYNNLEPSIPLNLVLANATVVADNSAGNGGGNLSATINATSVRIRNGLWPTGATLTPTDLANAGMGMELIADVTGGGADGRLGLDRVFAGLVNMVRTRDVVGTYRDTTASPPTTHRLRFIAASNAASASGTLSSRPLFRPGDPAPILFALPLLDTGRGSAGTGGETATMGRSGPHTAVNRPVGQRWTIRCVDSPSIGFPRTHPVNTSAVLSQVHYFYQFGACFCFWTNISGSRGATGDPADRVYGVLRIVNWNIVGDWNATFPAAPAAPVLTPTTPHRVLVPNRATINPIGRAQDHGVEVRPPSGIQIAAFDGST